MEANDGTIFTFAMSKSDIPGKFMGKSYQFLLLNEVEVEASS